MKIENTDRLRAATRAKKAGSTGSTDSAAFDSLLESAMGSGEIEKKSDIGATSSVTSLLGLQEVVDEGPSKQQIMEHGEAILQRLQMLHQAILSGTINMEQLRNLRERLSQRMDHVTDPEIRSVIREIEVRAAVELAKLEKMA